MPWVIRQTSSTLTTSIRNTAARRVPPTTGLAKAENDGLLAVDGFSTADIYVFDIGNLRNRSMSPARL